MEGWDQRGWEDRISGDGRIESVGIGRMGSVGMGGWDQRRWKDVISGDRRIESVGMGE